MKGSPREVVAPTSIPSPRGKHVKTDRNDARQLAQFYANGLVTIVSVPTPEHEQNSGLLRSRQNLVQQLTQVRNVWSVAMGCK